MGAPQVLQELHLDSIKLLHGFYPNINHQETDIFVFPHISPNHYRLNDNKRKKFVDINSKVETYLSQENGYDFVAHALDDLKTEYGIENIHQTNICTYESAKEGNLYSYTLSKEDTDQYPHACYNVVFAIK